MVMTFRSVVLAGSLVLVAAVVAACGEDGVTVAAAPSSWEELPDPPLGPRMEAAVAWTGREVVVVGGNDFHCGDAADCGLGDAAGFVDGAAFDPGAGTWRPIADAPVPVWSASATRLGDELFFLAVSNPRDQGRVLLRYDVAADQWDMVDLPEPMVDAQLQLVATDSALVLYPGSDEFGPVDDWKLDPASGEWEVLEDDPLGPAFDRLLVWGGEDLYLFDHALVPQPSGESGPSLVRAARMRDGGWETLPTGEVLGGGLPLVAGHRIVFPALGCSDGGEVNGYGRCIPHGAVFDTEMGTWVELPNAPGRENKNVFSAGAVSAEAAVVWGAGHPYLDTATDRWLTLPALDENADGSFQRWVHGVGPYGFVFGGAQFGDAAPNGELLGDAWLWSPLETNE